MQCPACHTEVSSSSPFCSQCGAPIAAGAVPMGTPPPPNYPPPGYAPPMPAAAGISDNAAAAIAYLTIIPAIIFLVLEPYSRIPLVRFHAWQCIGLTVGAVVLQTVVTILQIGLHFIPGIFLLFSLVHLAIGLGLFLVWLFVILKASKGEWYKLPVIGDFAEKQARS